MKTQLNIEFDTNDSWGLPEKRVMKNRENFTKFFTAEGKWHRRSEIFKIFTPLQVLRLAQLYEQYGYYMEEIFSFVRKYRKTTQQMTEQDIEDVKKLFDISQVMED